MYHPPKKKNLDFEHVHYPNMSLFFFSYLFFSLLLVSYNVFTRNSSYSGLSSCWSENWSTANTQRNHDHEWLDFRDGSHWWILRADQSCGIVSCPLLFPRWAIQRSDFYLLWQNRFSHLRYILIPSKIFHEIYYNCNSCKK